MSSALRPADTTGVPLADLAAAIGLDARVPDVLVRGVTLRAQDAQPGDLFAALAGSRAHGARYLPDAIGRGAVAVLTDEAGLAAAGAVSVPVLVHPRPRDVLGTLAAEVYGRPSESMAVIGITGTSGKTTTTYLIEAGLRAAGRTAGLIGTVGIRIAGQDVPSSLTTPEAPALQALLSKDTEIKVCV